MHCAGPVWRIAFHLASEVRQDVVRRCGARSSRRACPVPAAVRGPSGRNTHAHSTDRTSSRNAGRRRDLQPQRRLTWRFEDQGDGTRQIRNETAGTCLATQGAPAVGVRVVMKTCDAGNPAQSWRMVAGQTDLPSADPGGTATGWWSLRPADAPKYAAAAEVIGAVHSAIFLYRATNSADRLWHHARPWQSW
ncbi:RICIN domain-containing protein [Streptomyces sp. NPDC058326]|uniref:RICIN domain-containing protein n=1 Tax=Streptomyces sp. NPDC058326 TaxID=3346447 RepID=UPI0036EC01DA